MDLRKKLKGLYNVQEVIFRLLVKQKSKNLRNFSLFLSFYRRVQAV